MNEQEKTKKLEMLPWQALFDLAISKEIDENEIKGKEKNAIIFKLIHEAMISDSEIDNLVNDYIYGDRVSFTLWNFENNLTQEQYDRIYQLEGETEAFLPANGFRGLTVLSVKIVVIGLKSSMFTAKNTSILVKKEKVIAFGNSIEAAFGLASM